MKGREIAEIVGGMPVGAVHNFLHTKLDMKKMCDTIVDYQPKTHAKRHFRAVFDNA